MNQKLKRLPIGIQSFETIITDGAVYVDKTKQIYHLIDQGSRYFLARPRRFGKSLLLSTFQQLFLGKRELFKGLWVDQSDYRWSKHPVILLSLADLKYSSAEALENSLNWELDQIARKYNIEVAGAPSPQARLKVIVSELASTNKVVLLIDEYDHPINNNLKNIELARECRDVLRSFYVVIKELDPFLHFVFITGVSRFSKTSIFSGLNSLNDLTFNKETATLLGYTEDELKSYFDSYIQILAQIFNTNSLEIIEKIRLWYDGYQFSTRQTTKMYNPFSVLSCLYDKEFINYWFRTGTPTFLMDLIKAKNLPATSFEEIVISRYDAENLNIDDVSLKALLLQTGYLTIESYDSEADNFILTFPNHEVYVSFFTHLLHLISYIELGAINSFIANLINALKNNTLDQFFKTLQSFFATIPYTIHVPQMEKYYQSIIFVIAKLLGMNVDAEVTTNIGRIDLILQTPDYIYVCEFKMDKSAQEALYQIKENKYYQKYLTGSKKIVLIGVKFDSTERNLTKWLIERL